MLQLSAENRTIFGKKLKALRESGKIPAVLYGRKKASSSIFISLKDFKKVWKEAGESSIIEIKEENSKKPINVLIHDVVFDPIKDEPIHIDFYAVEMDKPLKATVPFIFTGVAPAVKELGGILVKVMHEIEIEALPKDLPHEINIDVSKLKTFDDQITIKDLNLSGSVKISAKPEEVITLTEPPKEEAEAEEEKIEIEDIEVTKKGKKEEEAGEVETKSEDQKKEKNE